MTRDELDVLRLELLEATRLSFEACRLESAGQSIYAYALVTSSEVGECLQPWCHTEEALARKEARWPAGSDAERQRYCPDEWWPVVSDLVRTRRGADFPALQDELVAAHDQFHEADPDIVMGLLVDTLEALDREGFFGTGAAREGVTLMVYVTDSAWSAEGWPGSVRRLNPPCVWERFRAAIG